MRTYAFRSPISFSSFFNCLHLIIFWKSWIYKLACIYLHASSTQLNQTLVHLLVSLRKDLLFSASSQSSPLQPLTSHDHCPPASSIKSIEGKWRTFFCWLDVREREPLSTSRPCTFSWQEWRSYVTYYALYSRYIPIDIVIVDAVSLCNFPSYRELFNSSYF